MTRGIERSTKITTKPAKKNRKRSSRWMWRFTSWSWILVKFSHRAESNGQKLLLADGEYKSMLTARYGVKLNYRQCCRLFQRLCLSYRKNNLSLVSVVTAVQREHIRHWLLYNRTYFTTVRGGRNGWSSTMPLAVMRIQLVEHTRHTSCVKKYVSGPKVDRNGWPSNNANPSIFVYDSLSV